MTMPRAVYSAGDLVHSTPVDDVRDAFRGEVVQAVRCDSGFAYVVRDAYGDDWHRSGDELQLLMAAGP